MLRTSTNVWCVTLIPVILGTLPLHLIFSPGSLSSHPLVHSHPLFFSSFSSLVFHSFSLLVPHVCMEVARRRTTPAGWPTSVWRSTTHAPLRTAWLDATWRPAPWLPACSSGSCLCLCESVNVYECVNQYEFLCSCEVAFSFFWFCESWLGVMWILHCAIVWILWDAWNYKMWCIIVRCIQVMIGNLWKLIAHKSWLWIWKLRWDKKRKEKIEMGNKWLTGEHTLVPGGNFTWY